MGADAELAQLLGDAAALAGPAAGNSCGPRPRRARSRRRSAPRSGATTEPTTKPLAAILSAIVFKSSSLISILICGSNRKISTPSNLTPSTSAAAVRSSIVSRSSEGSAPGEPLPTRPGHMALCSLGNVFLCVRTHEQILVGCGSPCDRLKWRRAAVGAGPPRFAGEVSPLRTRARSRPPWAGRGACRARSSAG